MIIMIGTVIGVSIGACVCLGIICRRFVRRRDRREGLFFLQFHAATNDEGAFNAAAVVAIA
jgi:hypothetical protein